MSKQRSPKLKDPSTISVEPNLNPECEGTHPDVLPFAEFSEHDVNFEKWDSIEFPKDKLMSQESQLFEDPQEIHLPEGYTVHQWKRCSEIYLNANFVIFSPITQYPDLVSSNQHLTGDFFKNFISSVEFLLYIGCNRTFPQEYEHSGYFTVGSKPWRPWDHIYSKCKVTKGEHSPIYNPAGKYIVRLFWMGTWRKIYVDDLIPLDMYDKILLPTMYVPKLTVQHSLEDLVVKPVKGKVKEKIPVKKDTIEIWPIILCKALLKIASLSPPSNNDFDIINCLTGWIQLRIKTKELPSTDLWDLFMGYVKHFEWDYGPEGNTKNTEISTKPKSKVKAGSDRLSKEAKQAIPVGLEAMPNGDRFVVASCTDISTLTEDNKNAGNKFIFLSEVRNIPLVQPLPRPELQFWKKFRYEKWAVEQGLLSPDIKELNIKSLRVVDPFRRIAKAHIGITIDDTLSLETDSTGKKSEKSSKSSKQSSKTPIKAAILEPDPSEWLDFIDIQNTITFLNVYYQPRTFKSKTKISDLLFAFKNSDFSHILSPFALRETRNEPVYMFMDSIDDKFLLINLAQMGDITMLQKIHKDKTPPPVAVESKNFDICEEIILKKTFIEPLKSILEGRQKQSITRFTQNHSISVVLEEYNWDSNKVGNYIKSINTLRSKSVIMQLKPGRHSFRIWLSTHCPYVLQIFSDTSYTIGSLDDYLTACTKESELLTNLCYEISSCFGKLVQSFGTPDQYQSLKKFYRCYRPRQSLNKKQISLMHRVFLDELFKTISSNLGQDVVKAVKLLFLQLKTFDYINPYIEEPHLSPQKFGLEEQVNYAKKMQRAAVKIEAFFKRIYIQAMLKKVNENHKEFSGIFEALKRVYQDIFSCDKRLTYCPKLFRKFFEHPQIKPFRDKFEIFQDLKSVLDLQIFHNSLIIQEPIWIPLCRQEFCINFNEPIPVKINIFSNLKTYSVRVFDNNDTNKEIKQLFNNVLVEKYAINKTGYTAIAYGWPHNDINKINYKLVFATKKMYRDDLILTPSTPLTTLTFKDQYIPNFNNIIFRYYIKVGADSYLTASLTTTYKEAKICLKLLNKEGKLVREICGKKNVVLPLVELQFSEPVASESRPNLYKNRSAVSANRMTNNYRKSLEGEAFKGSKRHKRTHSNESVGDELILTSNGENEQESKHLNRKSQIKSGSKLSLLGRSHKSTAKTVNMSRVLDFAHTVYTLEAKVIGDSWPLTADEWDRVQKAREKNYINPIEDVSNFQKKSKKSVVSTSLEEPYWTLDLVYAAGNVLEFKRDNSENEQRKLIKLTWFNDPDRYTKAVELRKAYIQDHLEQRNASSIDKTLRSNNATDFALKVIKDEPFEQYMTKPLDEVELDFCKTKNDDDYVIDEANIERQIKQYQNEEQATKEEIEGQLQEQMENFEVLSKWFEEIRNDSLAMMADALEIKRDYVKKFLQVVSKTKDDKKGKEKKKK